MKPVNVRELRTGNYIRTNIDVFMEIYPSDIVSIMHNKSSEKYYTIPITVEFLEALGFHDRSGDLANRLGFGININTLLELCWYVQKNDDEGIRLQTIGSGFTMDTKCIYVHQLQNLYHSLTQKELVIKDYQKYKHLIDQRSIF